MAMDFHIMLKNSLFSSSLETFFVFVFVFLLEALLFRFEHPDL